MLIVTLIRTGQERNDELYMYSVYIVTISTGVAAKPFNRPMSAMNRPTSANPYATTNPTVGKK